MSNRIVAFAVSILLAGCSSLTASQQVAGQQLGDPAAAAAEVRRLEDAFAAAFNSRDYSSVERLLAPEFMLASSGRPQGTTFARREEWLRNWRGMAPVPFEAKVLDVVVAGDTAVATLEARWQRESFLTDTWVKRNGQWQVIFRHSSPRSVTAPGSGTRP